MNFPIFVDRYIESLKIVILIEQVIVNLSTFLTINHIFHAHNAWELSRNVLS